ncbi:MAG: AI-2E family transporter [Candidatus Hydrogenedentes bacterium]|nr:AI-2E family transporter [Candidatus Hydrogenedentota bacterium]
MFKELWANLWVRLAALAGVVVLLLLFILALRSVLVPLLFAFIVAYIFDPVADAFERRKLSRNLAVLWIVTLLLLAAIALPLVLVPSMVVEANNMIEEARQERAEKSAQPGSEDALNFAQRWLERGLQHLPLEQIAEGLGLTTETVPRPPQPRTRRPPMLPKPLPLRQPPV